MKPSTPILTLSAPFADATAIPSDKLLTRSVLVGGATAALIHTDLGTGDHTANMAMATWLGPALDALAGPGGYVLANQALSVPRWQLQPEPPGVPKDRYFLYRAG